MNKFWNEEIPSGYYDEILTNGIKKNKGIQPNWHHSTFAHIKDLLVETDVHLDYACGPGTLIGRYLDSKSIGVDISKSQIEYATNKYGSEGKFYNLNDFELDKYDNFFDKITILGLFEFINDDEVISLLNRLYLALKEGGEIYITTPNYKSSMLIFEKILNLIGSVNYQEQHINRFDEKRLKQLMNESKFSKIEVKKILNLGVFFGIVSFDFSKKIQIMFDKLTNKNFGYLLLGILKK